MARERGSARERMRRATRAVAQQVVRQDVPWDFRVGTVTATSPLTVQYADGVSLTGFARLASYSPTINDVVLVLVRSPTATILGKFA